MKLVFRSQNPVHISFVEATLRSEGFSVLVMDDLDVQWYLKGQWAPLRKVYVLEEEAKEAVSLLIDAWDAIKTDSNDVPPVGESRG